MNPDHTPDRDAYRQWVDNRLSPLARAQSVPAALAAYRAALGTVGHLQSERCRVLRELGTLHWRLEQIDDELKALQNLSPDPETPPQS